MQRKKKKKETAQVTALVRHHPVRLEDRAVKLELPAPASVLLLTGIIISSPEGKDTHTQSRSLKFQQFLFEAKSLFILGSKNKISF